MNVTCALIVINPSGKILLVHPTNGRQKGGWSIPKGIADDGEELIDAAIRELQEETGVSISHMKDSVVELGRFPYVPKKDIFYCYVRSPVELSAKTMICESCFTMGVQQVPEVDAFIFVDFDTALGLLNIKQSEIVKNFKDILTLNFDF